MAGIYIHIPYCKQKCSYCNFHFSTQMSSKAEMLKAMVKEIQNREIELQSRTIETIYFGGGTPTLLSVDEINQLISAIAKITPISALKEVTIEANPDDLSLEYINQLKDHTVVDRLSVGIQSFHDVHLHWMNRAHTGAIAHRVLSEIFERGFKKVTADLIFGLPDNNMMLWTSNIDQLTQYPVNHISCYGLTVEPKTALKKAIEIGKIPAPEENAGKEQFLLTQTLLNEKGYEQYELSNYALPHAYAIHNSNYWKQVPYIGIGPSAHSYDGQSRRWNVAHNAQYIENVLSGKEYWSRETLSEADQYNEWIMTGLRTKWGLDIFQLTTFGSSIQEEFYRALEKARNRSWVDESGTQITLSRQGKVLADTVMSSFFYV